MKSWIKYTVLGLALYCVFLIATIPASLVVSKLPLPEQVQIGQMKGTLWAGQVDTLVVDGIALKNVKWQVAFSQVFTGKLAVDVKWGSKRKILAPYGEGLAYIGFSGTGIANAKMSLPAEVIKPKINMPMLESLQGLVKLNITQATMGTPYCSELIGDLTWQQPSLAVMGGAFDLGDLNAKLACAEGNVTATVKGDEKTLMLEADLELAAKNKFKLAGFVKAGSDADKSLITALSFIGRADSQGRYPINFNN